MVVFFFKQKTAYELHISDWSSDVCSSDLRDDLREIDEEAHRPGKQKNLVGDRLAGREPRCRNRPRMHEVRKRHAASRCLETEAGKALEDDGGEVREVADNEGEDADIDRKSTRLNSSH